MNLTSTGREVLCRAKRLASVADEGIDAAVERDPDLL